MGFIEDMIKQGISVSIGGNSPGVSLSLGGDGSNTNLSIKEAREILVWKPRGFVMGKKSLRYSDVESISQSFSGGLEINRKGTIFSIEIDDDDEKASFMRWAKAVGLDIEAGL